MRFVTLKPMSQSSDELLMFRAFYGAKMTGLFVSRCNSCDEVCNYRQERRQAGYNSNLNVLFKEDVLTT